MRKNIFILILTVMFFAADAAGQIPHTVGFQADIRSSGNPIADGMHAVVVSIYDQASGGNLLYSEPQQVAFVRGIFTEIIGAVTPLPDSLKYDRPYFFAIAIDGAPEISPRTPFSSAPYSLYAERAEGLTSDAVIPKNLQPRSATATGVAGGDLSGSYPGPRVTGLQSHPVSSINPQPQDVLTWDGTSWVPSSAYKPVAFHVGMTGTVPVSSLSPIAHLTEVAGETPNDVQYFSADGSYFTVPVSGIYHFDACFSMTLLFYSDAFNYGYPVFFFSTVALSIDDKIAYDQKVIQATNGFSWEEEPYTVQYDKTVSLTAGQKVKLLFAPVSSQTFNTTTKVYVLFSGFKIR